MEIYYINLNRRSDKRMFFENRINRTIFRDKYKRFTAIEHNNGRVGCALSHIELWKKCIDNNMMVFEDDTIFKINYNKNIEIILNNLPDDFDIVYLNSSKDIVINPYNNLFSKIRAKCTGTWNYILSPKGAKKLLDFITPYNKSRQIDTQMSGLIHKHKIIGYLSLLPTVYTIQDYNDSDCQPRRDEINIVDFHK